MEDDIIWGRRTVLEFLRSGSPINRIFITPQGQGLSRELFELAKERGVPVVRSERDRLDRLCNRGNHQGVVAQVGSREFVGFQELLERAAASGRTPLLVALDGVQDPGNLGAILRTAEGAGCQGVLQSARSSCGLTAAVSKASAGADAHIPVARVDRLDRTLLQLREAGFQVVGSAPTAEKRYFELDYRNPTVFVLGGEGLGVDRKVAEACSQVVLLPMLGQVESLNVSVSAAVLLYEAVRQRLS